MRFALIVIIIGLLPGWILAQNTVQWATNYYSVTGATLPEIHRSFRQSRPWRDRSNHDGLTVWRVYWNFHVANADGRCRMNSFSTKTTINITLPRWSVPTNVEPAAIKNWQRYITALGQHEAGHAQFALAAAAEMHRRMKEVSEDANCESLKARINSLGQAIVADYKNREKEYDQRTKHGESQGATLRFGRRPGE